MTFLDFLEKCQLLYLLDKLNEGSDEELDEETKKQLFQGSDQIWLRLLFFINENNFLTNSKIQRLLRKDSIKIYLDLRLSVVIDIFDRELECHP